MSGTTTNTKTNYDANIFTRERGEYGMLVFSDPRRQATYEYHETEYRKKYVLKQAYDKQEFLRKMRADIKRECLTRKKQMKRLQMDAAVDFRNAESSLQEHYAGAQGQEPWRIHGVDICAPLVSQIQLPSGETLDLKTLDCDTEFAKVRRVHEDLRLDQLESIRICEEEEQRQREYEAANEASWNQWTQQQYQQRRPYAPRGEEQQPQQPQQQEQQQPEEEQPGRYGDGGYCGCDDLECSDCYSYGGDEKDDRSSYDSEYDYPREYNYERECREREEAAAAQAAEQQRWEENTRDEDGLWDEEARADEAEHRREVALMKLNDDMTYTCDDHPDVQQLEVVAITEPKQRITASAASSGGISAQKKASAGAAKKAAKARQAKQELKKKAKFVPFKITANTNRVSKEGSDAEEEQTPTLLYQGKAQVNLPKKNLQNVSREDKKRHIAKWRRIETAEKHASARGTRIANILNRGRGTTAAGPTSTTTNTKMATHTPNAAR
jgi:hypothetical protein